MGHVKETPQATSVTPNKCYQLQTAVGELWDAVSQDEIQSLIYSMPRRLEAIRRARGGNTQY